MNEPEHDDDRTQSLVTLKSGVVVSHYRIIEKIGAGGMGEVYLAEDTELNRKVALKFLPPHLCQDADCRARFKREAQAAAGLEHPNIVTVHEVGEYQGRPFIAMQHLEGQSLRDLIESKEMSADQAVNLTIQICEGLDKAHKAGIVHRDIKPSNIVVDTDGRPKLLDFGLAAVGGADRLTKIGSTLGTVGYMSPEQARGQELDQRSDLFSLGVVLYEMITGRRPFRGKDEATTLHAVTHNTPEPLARYRAGVPDDLQRVVDKALQKDASVRYQTAAGMLADLRLWETGQTGRPKGKKPWAMVAAAVLVIAVGGYFVYQEFLSVTGDAQDQPRRIAVLPFENLGDPEDEYFADGITDEITSRLAVTGDLHVISRTSANQYKGTQKGLPEIARELNVDYILEGTIRWDHSGETSRVRITPQLIQVVDDRHLWAQNYERTLTQIFAVQADIATNIAEALNITLLQREQQPTEDIEAYNAYLRGKYYMERPDYFESDYRMAVEMFERAVSLDQGFALAHSWLARAHLALYHQGYDRTEVRRALAKTSVDRALELDPNLGEAHLSLGIYFYWGHRDYERALAELKIAGNLLPNNADVLTFIAAVYRRQGGFEEATDLFKRSFELNPRSTQVAVEIMYTLHWMRRYEEAMDYCNQCISLVPDQKDAYELKRGIHINWHGDIEQARKALVEMSTSATDDRALVWYEQAWIERDFRAALDSLATIQSDIDIDQTDFIPVALYMAQAFQQSGLDEEARRFFDSALFILEREAQTRPGDYRIRQSLGLAYAGLGEVENAVREAEYATELFPMSRDAFFGSYVVIDLATVYTMVGKYDEALDRLEYLLARPSNISTSRLRVDPRWDPLRDHPRFQELLEKFEKIHGT